MADDHSGARQFRWPWIALLWSICGLFDASQTIVVMRVEGRQQPWLPLFAFEFAIWLPWALSTRSIVQLARTRDFVRRFGFATVLPHVLAYLLLSGVTEAWSAWLQVLFNPWGNNPWPTFIDTFSATWVFQAFTFLVVYVLLIIATYLVDARDRIATQAAEAARLSGELAQAQLAALRGQLEPHFIYNALNSISGLVRDHRNDAAVSMIVGLSEFLRRASEDSHRTQVALAEEVEYLQRYLDIQKVRFGERLRPSIDVPEDLLRVQVPNLLLQPLVENAIKHGLSKLVEGGAVRIAAVRRDQSLRLSVYNDGPPTAADRQSTRVGVGLDNLRTRLQIMYGDQCDLLLNGNGLGGVEVVVVLPLMES